MNLEEKIYIKNQLPIKEIIILINNLTIIIISIIKIIMKKNSLIIIIKEVKCMKATIVIHKIINMLI